VSDEPGSIGAILKAFAESQRQHLQESEALRTELLWRLDEIRALAAGWQHEPNKEVLTELYLCFRLVVEQLLAAYRLAYRLAYAEDVTDEEGKPMPPVPCRQPVN
jgi:hypothetical protein